MKDLVVLRVVSKLLIPYILLFGLYVQMHGDFGPGGGFQAGVIFASEFILYGLIFGTTRIRRVMPQRVLLGFISLGVLLFAGTGVAALVLGGNFLAYGALAADPVSGQHLGILLVELGVGITVSAVMLTIFVTFTGRDR